MRQETAEQIIERISEQGFWKGDEAHMPPGTCLLLAFDDVTLNGLIETDAELQASEQAIADTIQAMFPERVLSILAPQRPASVMVRFNDHPNTTEDDIAAVLRACVSA